MQRRSQKILLSLTIVGSGLLIAMPFRRVEVHQGANAGGEMMPSVATEAPAGPLTASGYFEGTLAAPTQSERATPPLHHAPPLGDRPAWASAPPLAPTFDSAPEMNSAEVADSAAQWLTHKLGDGDTLSRLAQRYLGSVERAGEIYNANRDTLASPDLLPIGREIRIPPRHATPTISADETPLVPVPPITRPAAFRRMSAS